MKLSPAENVAVHAILRYAQAVRQPETEETGGHQPSADPNVAAFNLVQQIIESGEAEGKNPLAVVLGRRGGLKGGKARASKMSANERSMSASKAAIARWASAKS